MCIQSGARASARIPDITLSRTSIQYSVSAEHQRLHIPPIVSYVLALLVVSLSSFYSIITVNVFFIRHPFLLGNWKNVNTIYLQLIMSHWHEPSCTTNPDIVINGGIPRCRTYGASPSLQELIDNPDALSPVPSRAPIESN
jgi:hypothetical protein